MQTASVFSQEAGDFTRNRTRGRQCKILIERMALGFVDYRCKSGETQANTSSSRLWVKTPLGVNDLSTGVT